MSSEQQQQPQGDVPADANESKNEFLVDAFFLQRTANEILIDRLSKNKKKLNNTL